MIYSVSCATCGRENILLFLRAEQFMNRTPCNKKPKHRHVDAMTKPNLKRVVCARMIRFWVRNLPRGKGNKIIYLRCFYGNKRQTRPNSRVGKYYDEYYGKSGNSKINIDNIHDSWSVLRCCDTLYLIGTYCFLHDVYNCDNHVVLNIITRRCWNFNSERVAGVTSHH